MLDMGREFKLCSACFAMLHNIREVTSQTLTELQKKRIHLELVKFVKLKHLLDSSKSSI